MKERIKEKVGEEKGKGRKKGKVLELVNRREETKGIGDKRKGETGRRKDS